MQPAEPFAAAVLAAGEIQFVPQDAEQVAIRFRRDLVRYAVDRKRDHAGHGSILEEKFATRQRL